MKRIYLAFVSLFFIPLISILFCSVSFAAAPDYLAFQNYVSQTFGDTYVTTENAYNYFVNTMYNQYPNRYVFMVEEGNHIFMCFAQSRSIGTDTFTMGPVYAGISSNASGGPGMSSNSSWTVSKSVARYYETFDDFVDAVNSVNIDFDNIYYSPNIPIPNMDVYYVLTSSVGGSKVAIWNAEMSIADNSDFYVQYGYKISVPGLVGIGLDSSTGQYDYSYESYSDGTYVDYKSLEDLQACVNISFGSSEMSSAWQSAYDNMYDLMPDFYAKIPFWVQNPNAAKYVEAQEYYKDFMMTQLPMFGNRLELFARFFTVNEDNQVIVGDWLHWSSRTGSRTQEKPSNYIDNVELPGYINSSNNVNLESQDNTYQQSGESVGAATVINNNYAPNYPDYPTIASYNKDNLLLDTMGYMSNMNNFLSGPNGFGHFLTEVFTFIPSYVWGMVAMGFGVAIIVMFIKML